MQEYSPVTVQVALYICLKGPVAIYDFTAVANRCMVLYYCPYNYSIRNG